MKFGLLLLVFGYFSIEAAHAQEKLLMLQGNLSSYYGFASQPILVRNKTGKTVGQIGVQCKFLNGTDIIGEGSQNAFDVVAQGVVAVDVVTFTSKPAERAECQVWTPE